MPQNTDIIHFPKNRACFLDRDGVINIAYPGRYVSSISEFEMIEGVPGAIKLLNDAGYLVIVITNQQGVGKEEFSQATLEDIHNYMMVEVELQGARIDWVYFCPHIEGTCTCRKPKPGLFYKAAEDYNIDLEKSLMIGDSVTDGQAAMAAGCNSVQIPANSPGLLRMLVKIILEYGWH